MGAAFTVLKETGSDFLLMILKVTLVVCANNLAGKRKAINKVEKKKYFNARFGVKLNFMQAGKVYAKLTEVLNSCVFQLLDFCEMKS